MERPEGGELWLGGDEAHRSVLLREIGLENLDPLAIEHGPAHRLLHRIHRALWVRVVLVDAFRVAVGVQARSAVRSAGGAELSFA
jgi:hypothetical protein